MNPCPEVLPSRKLDSLKMKNPTPANQSFAHLAHPKYRPDIDGLRAIAVIAVVGFHYFPGQLKGGFIGVDIFFVISGFLISSIVFSNLEQGRFSFAEFYSRRIRRIFPALITVMLACFAFGWFALIADEYRQIGKHILGGAGFVSNFVLWTESGYFDNSAETKPLLHFWSLAIEEQFYLFWPLLLAFVWQRRGNFLLITALIAIVSFTANIYLIHTSRIAAFYSPIARFWELMIGGILAYLSLHRPESIHRFKNMQAVLGVTLLTLGLVLIRKANAFPGWWALLPAVGAFGLIAAGPTAWFNRKILANRILVRIGLISYTLYLWHWPLLSFARIAEGEEPADSIRIAALLISLALAGMTTRWIEKPIRFGPHGKAKTIALATAMAMVAYLGYLPYQRNGLEFRAAVTDFTLNSQVTGQFVGPGWQYAKNVSCLNRYPFKEADDYSWWFCMLSKEQDPTIVLLGNSYANHLYPGLAQQTRLRRHTILSIGTCSPVEVDESTLIEGDNKSPCAGKHAWHQHQFINEIIEKTGSIRFAILDGLSRKPDTNYIEHLRKRIDFLEKNKIKVIVFTPHLHADYDIRGCFSRPFKRHIKTCSLSRTEREALLANFKVLRDRLAETNPNVAFFDQNELFCQGENCSFVRDGMPLFRDEFHHLSEYGSKELAKVFLSWADKNVPELFSPASLPDD